MDGREALDPTRLLTSLFRSVVIIDRSGQVVESYGSCGDGPSLSADPVLARAWEPIRACLDGTPFEREFDGCRIRGVPLEDGRVAVVTWKPLATDSKPCEFDFLVNHIRQGAWRTDGSGKILFANHYLASWLDTSPEDMIGEPASRYMLDPVESPEVRFRTAGGAEKRAVVSHFRAPGQVERVDLISESTPEQAIRADLVEEVRRMAQLARTDPLTGLANRIEFQDGLRHAKESDAPFALILTDLDDFKTINDTFGHVVGDRVLVEVAQRLRAAVRDSDLVARLGGDEFAVLVPRADLARAHEVFERVIDRLQFQMNVDGHEIDVVVSAGYAHSIDHRDDILEVADQEMYRYKRLKKQA
jgi:diguanylate cyclase (GGDEF)-like protein